MHRYADFVLLWQCLVSSAFTHRFGPGKDNLPALLYPQRTSLLGLRRAVHVRTIGRRTERQAERSRAASVVRLDPTYGQDTFHLHQSLDEHTDPSRWHKVTSCDMIQYVIKCCDCRTDDGFTHLRGFSIPVLTAPDSEKGPPRSAGSSCF